MTEIIITNFDQVKSVKKFDQVISEISIKWKNTISIKWNSIKWSFAVFPPEDLCVHGNLAANQLFETPKSRGLSCLLESLETITSWMKKKKARSLYFWNFFRQGSILSSLECFRNVKSSLFCFKQWQWYSQSIMPRGYRHKNYQLSQRLHR